MSNIKIIGSFSITPKLSDYDNFYLHNFNATQHIKRDESKLIDIYGGTNGYNGHYGTEGDFFINYIFDPNGNSMNKNRGGWVNKDFNEYQSIIDDKNPPVSQPGMYCPWKPNITGYRLTPDNKDYYQSNFAWLKWLINNFFDGMYKLNGEVTITSHQTNMERRIELRDNDIKYRSKKLENRGYQPGDGIKENSVILGDIISKTKNGEIEWTKEELGDTRLIPRINIKRFSSRINIKNDVSLLLNLFVRGNTNSNKNYINIHLKKPKSTKLFRCIKNYKVNDLVEMVINK